MSRYFSRATAPAAVSIAAFDGVQPIGLAVFERTGEVRFTILIITVRRERRNQGVGRLLIDHLIRAEGDPIIEAETDGDAVGFYHSLGFRIRSLGEKYPGIERFRCIYDHRNWDPIDPREIAGRLEAAGVDCWISGGWAIDLFLGRKTRAHHDTDVSVKRSDQHRVREVLHAWEAFSTHAPGLKLWRGCHYLESVPNTWYRRSATEPWSLDVQYVNVEGDEWVYRRDPSIRGPISDMAVRTDGGVRCLRPEIQLLYKGGGSSIRDVDVADFRVCLPVLTKEARRWLLRGLSTEFPNGHEWLDAIRNATPPT